MTKIKYAVKFEMPTERYKTADDAAEVVNRAVVIAKDFTLIHTIRQDFVPHPMIIGVPLQVKIVIRDENKEAAHQLMYGLLKYIKAHWKVTWDVPNQLKVIGEAEVCQKLRSK